MGAAELVGSWSIYRWRLSVGGEWRPPFLGADASGLLVYSADGWMSAILMAANRPVLGPAGFGPGDPATKVAVSDGYVSYAGHYELRGNEISHHVRFSLYPDWIGQTLRRQVSWDDGRLTLTTPAVTTSTGKEIFDELTWIKNK